MRTTPTSKQLQFRFFAISIVIGLPLVMLTKQVWLFAVVAGAVALVFHLWARVTGRLDG